MGDPDGVESFSALPLYWRVCLINTVVFLAATVVLVVTPATVSPEVTDSELVVLAAGLGLILVFNALLLRRSLAPIDRLVTLMQQVDLERPGQRLPEAGDRAVGQLVDSFNAMMSRLELERARSNAQALAAQEAERHRIAQELHDQIGQGLTVVLLGLRRAVDRAPAELVEELRLVQETARISLDEAREVARRLRPGVLEDLGLVSALTALATEFSTPTGGFVHCRLDSRLPALTSEAELVIYRVAQEALTNAARHAHADTVELALSLESSGPSGTVTLRVTDNGCGRRGRPEGTGIRGMRERALLVRGKLTVRSPMDGGTEVSLAVPLAVNARAEVAS